MDWQTIIAYILGAVALVYVIKIFIKQFSHTEVNPKCDKCPISELKNHKMK